MRLRVCYSVFLLFLIVSTAETLQGQRMIDGELKPCSEHPTNKGKYKILSESPGGKESQFYLEIKPKYRNEKNYLIIAKEFKEKYCHENRLRVIYLTGKKQWLILDPFNLEATPLAVFYTGIGTDEKEGLDVYTVVDGKVVTRKLKIDD